MLDPIKNDPRVLRLVTLLRRDRLQRARDYVAGQLETVCPERIYTDLLIPAVVVTGELCLAGELPKPQAEVIVEQLRQLFALPRARLQPRPRLAQRLFATHVPGDVYGVGLEAICDWLSRDGWDVLFKYPPADTLDEVVRQALAAAPAVVVISVRFPRFMTRAKQMVTALRAGGYAGPIWIGGISANAAPDLLAKCGATHSAPCIVSFTRRLAAEFGYQTGTPADLEESGKG